MNDDVTGLPGSAASAATDSVGAAHEIAAHGGGTAGERLLAASNDAFVHGMATTATLAAVARQSSAPSSRSSCSRRRNAPSTRRSTLCGQAAA